MGGESVPLLIRGTEGDPEIETKSEKDEAQAVSRYRLGYERRSGRRKARSMLKHTIKTLSYILFHLHIGGARLS